jgi:hypothetical protein
MATSSKGRATPVARKSTAKTRAAVSTPSRLPAAGSTTTTAVKPPTVAVVPLRPPLEAALDAFARELRAALDRAAADTAALRAEVATLRTEATQLRQRYESHTHTYQRLTTGGGAQHWIELRFLQSYIDGEHAGFKNYGIWTRGKSTPDVGPDHQTTGPSG